MFRILWRASSRASEAGSFSPQMDDIITYINRAGEKILGYTKHELAGKPFDIFQPERKANHGPFPSGPFG